MTQDGASPDSCSANPQLIEDVEGMIHLIEGEYVVFAGDLSRLYGISSRDLEKAVERNPGRFPPDFAFCPRPLSLAFTLAGIGMLGSVFRSRRVVQMNVTIMRTIAKIRDANRVRATRGADATH